MRTKPEIAKILIDRDASKEAGLATWSNLMSMLSGLSDEKKAYLLGSIISNNGKRVIGLLNKEMMTIAVSRSSTRINAMLADNTITIADMDSLL